MASSEPKKRKYKRRREMTPEQKQAATERLAAAREKRLIANPPEYKSVHEDVLALDDEHNWSHKNVKKYIKAQKELLTAQKQAVRRGDKGSDAKYIATQTYIKNMERYLRTGIWLDKFWGEDHNIRVKDICYVMAYHHEGPLKGKPKRSHGVYYSDLGTTYDRKMGNI